jgi:hypothetical protein
LVELHDGQGSFSNAGESTGPTFSKHDVPWQTNVHRANLFVFTILREPLLHAISYYNFFHKHQVNDATEKKNERTCVVANQQCATLSHYKKRWWFWIGTTKRLERQ